MKYKVGDIVIRTEYDAGTVGKITDINLAHQGTYKVKVLRPPVDSGLKVGQMSQWTSNYFRKYTKLDRLLDGEVVEIDTER